jgi:hypothetical protein
MRLRFLVVLLLLCAGCTQAPKSETAAPAAPPAAPAGQVHGDLRQVMRGILFPNSNVVFAAQDKLDVKQAKDPSTATDPLASTYGGWQAVENSSIALAEAANLLIIPGRKCSNGRDVPVNNEDWKKFVQELRDAGMNTYKAAQSKSTDKIVDAAGSMTEACSHCHDKYREKPAGEKDRCM